MRGGAIFNKLYIFRGNVKSNEKKTTTSSSKAVRSESVSGTNYRHSAISSVKCENLIVKYVRES